jgi:hypothetical protein
MRCKQPLQSTSSSVLAPPWAPPWLRQVAAVAGGVYLLSIWLAAAGSALPEHVLPLPVRFFTQVAELFPMASPDAIEWRVRGWRCDLVRFEEIDVRPFFPIRRDDKENQFDRAMFFHHRQRTVLEALDEYLVATQNRMRPDQRIGGVMLLSLRIPIPPLGVPGPRERWMPIDEVPASATRKYWYVTASEVRQHRCQEAP